MMMLFICRQSSCSSADNHIVLSVDNISVLVAVLVDERLVVLGHTTQRHTHVRESAVVEKSLHSNLLGKVGEHHNAIVGTFVGTCIAKWRHTVAEVVKTIKALDTASGCGECRRLRNSVDAHLLLAAIDIAEAACYRLKQRLGVCHVIVAEESTV